MSKRSDGGAAKLVKQLAAKGAHHKRSALIEKFQKLRAGEDDSSKHALSAALEMALAASGGNTEMAAEQLSAVGKLLEQGFSATTKVLCDVYQEQLGRLPFETVWSVIPDARSVAVWVRRSRSGKKQLIKRIAEQPEQFASSPWCDWYIKAAPIKMLGKYGEYLLDADRRAPWLAQPEKLLFAAVKRDRRGDLLMELRILSSGSSMRTKRLIRTCLQEPSIASALAQGYGRAIVSGATSGNELFEVIETMLKSDSRAAPPRLAVLAAHISTTMALWSKDGLAEDVMETLRDNAKSMWVLGGENGAVDPWCALSVSELQNGIMSSQGMVSVTAAMQIALGLRAMDINGQTQDALWSTAFNVNVREFGKQGETVGFNPQLHEDSEGGLLPDKPAKVLHRGWKYGDTVLLRCQVVAVK